VAADMDSIYDWSSVVRIPDAPPDDIRKHLLVYNEDDDEQQSSNTQVLIRVQGFLKNFNLGALGTWRGAERDAPKAVQFVELESSGFDIPFDAQDGFLAAIKSMIRSALSAGGSSDDDVAVGGGTIHLERRVFQRVRASDRGKVSSVLRPADDLLGRAAKIGTRWTVSHRVKTGIQRGDGRILLCNPMVFKKGDFVDIAVYADIATLRDGHRTRTVVHFAMQEVVRLRSVEELRQVLPKRKDVGALERAQFETMASGFDFGGDVEEGNMLA